jgi:DNA modification methylase
MSTQRIVAGDCIAGLQALPDASVHCCVTSPPYWGLRDYGHDGQIGLEPTPEAYVARMVEVFREVRRVLRDDGTLWLNLGDSYAAARGGTSMPAETLAGGVSGRGDTVAKRGRESGYTPHRDPAAHGLKHKDLVGIPWRVAFALQQDGWWLRQDIIWHKPNPMPESVRDRCTKAHEYVFLLTKSERYFYDADSVREPIKQGAAKGLLENRDLRMSEKEKERARIAREVWGSNQMSRPAHAMFQGYDEIKGANRRSVWTVATKPYSGAHFAVMPPDLVEPCIKAGCPEGGTVLDPFAGSGTTLAVAATLGRNAIGCELNPAYIELAEVRIREARSTVALFEGATA